MLRAPHGSIGRRFVTVPSSWEERGLCLLRTPAAMLKEKPSGLLRAADCALNVNFHLKPVPLVLRVVQQAVDI